MRKDQDLLTKWKEAKTLPRLLDGHVSPERLKEWMYKEPEGCKDWPHKGLGGCCPYCCTHWSVCWEGYFGGPMG